MTTEKQTRIGVYLSEELARKIRRAAALESAEKGTTVSASRWMREAARRRLREENTTNTEEEA